MKSTVPDHPFEGCVLTPIGPLTLTSRIGTGISIQHWEESPKLISTIASAHTSCCPLRMATVMSPSTSSSSHSVLYGPQAFSLCSRSLRRWLRHRGSVHRYLQFRTGWLRSVLEWSRSVSELWLTDLYGPIHYETNVLIVNGDTCMSLPLTRDHYATLMPFSGDLTTLA